MPSRTFLPSLEPSTVRTSTGEIVRVPAGWMHLEPGDAALTRRVKAAGDHWVVEERVGRRIFSRGVWAPRETVERIRGELGVERSSPEHAKKQAAALRRRTRVQSDYVATFADAVIAFLSFHERHADLARAVARAVTEHATPVGSGTVARTTRIPIERRAQAAVIAWMRHHTTAYDSMAIPRIKGHRREVRRMLARRSQELLQRYRTGGSVSLTCPLAEAVGRLTKAG
ncbi:MAG: DUF2293 domain-containing protein [Planctomycetia bacterium]